MEGSDRTCEVMLKFDNPLGIIVYKNNLQNEYSLKNALELKHSFFLTLIKIVGMDMGQGYSREWMKLPKKWAQKSFTVLPALR